jgi:GTPase Era involved in 16S rRNA processing
MIPWLPFNSESEFSFAEIILKSAMSNRQIDALIEVIHKLLKHNEAFRVQNHIELEQLWTGASDELAPVH